MQARRFTLVTVFCFLFQLRTWTVCGQWCVRASCNVELFASAACKCLHAKLPAAFDSVKIGVETRKGIIIYLLFFLWHNQILHSMPSDSLTKQDVPHSYKILYKVCLKIEILWSTQTKWTNNVWNLFNKKITLPNWVLKYTSSKS